MTLSGVDGSFVVSGIPAGSYTVTAFPPAGSQLRKRTVTITLAAGVARTVDLILEGPTGPPTGSGISPSSLGGDGIPMVYWNTASTVSTTGCAGGSATWRVSAPDGTTISNGTMTEGAAGSYTGTVPPLAPGAVTPGSRLRSHRAGCLATDGSPYTQTAVLTIPPAVFDVDLRLDCNDPPTLTVADVTLQGNTTGGYTGVIPGVSATDPDGDEPSLVSDAPVVLPLGVTTVLWTATDADGETASATQRVTVVDTTAPALTCPENVLGVVGEQVTIGAGRASDAVDDALLITSDSAAPFGPGITMVSHTATDQAGNVSTCRQQVWLKYVFTGFLNGVVHHVDGANVGQALPFKWRLQNSTGAYVRSMATVTGFGFDATGGTYQAISYDVAAEHFVLVAKSASAWAGTTKTFKVKLDDGTEHTVRITLRR